MKIDIAYEKTWLRALKKLPLEMAIERKYYEITAAMIRDEALRSLFVPKWMISEK